MTTDGAEPATEAANLLGAPVASSTAAALSELEALTIPGSSCPRHPDMLAAGTCARCGTFFCARCVESVLEESIECPSCLETKEARDAPAVVRAIIREQWITLALLGLLVGGVGFAGVISTSERFNFESEGTYLALAALAGTIMALPFIIAALVVGLVRRMWASWAGYVIEALMFLLIALISLGFNVITAIALGVPIWSLTRILRMAELVKKYPNVLGEGRSA